MAAEPTTRDALIAEMLGDIGRLHDSVESLKNILPGQAEEVEEKIIGLIGLLSKAGDTYRDQFETYTSEQAEKVRVQMEKDAQTAKARFDRDSSDAIRAALNGVERTVRDVVQNEIAAPVKKSLREQQQGIWRTLGICTICGIIGAATVLMAGIYIGKPLIQERICDKTRTERNQ